MFAFLLSIYLATISLCAGDVSHVKNTYLPPTNTHEASASVQHEVFAPVMIVGEPARFVSYALPDAALGEASNQISAFIPAPALDDESTFQNYHYETAPSNFISYSAPAPNSEQNFEAAPSFAVNYFETAPDQVELFSHHNDLQQFEAAPSNEVKFTAAAPSFSVYSYSTSNEKSEKFEPAASHSLEVKAPVADSSLSFYNYIANKNKAEIAPVEASSNIDTEYAPGGGYIYEPKVKRFANFEEFFKV